MEFISGFSWAVPTAFADAVALCRFEQGDTLYDTPKAYEENWSEATEHINHWLQVRYTSGPKTVAGDSTGSIFAKNWNSEIRVDLYKKLKNVGEGQIQTTQGRLYTALWTGNVDILQMEYKEPKAPLNVQEVNRKLKDTANKAGEFSKGFPVFVMARDLSNKISQAKYTKIFSKLRNHMSDDPQVLNPKLAGIKDWNGFAPTIEIAFFPLIDLNQKEVEALVKEAVYVPTKNVKKEMFKIAAYGTIF
jgi:hypothetical protein